MHMRVFVCWANSNALNTEHLLSATSCDDISSSSLLIIMCPYICRPVCVLCGCQRDVTGPLSWPCTCGLSHSPSLTQCTATGHELMQETEPHTHMPKAEPPAS